MTRASIRECTEAVRWRYLRSSKKDKGKIFPLAFCSTSKQYIIFDKSSTAGLFKGGY
jgi:hypothetical protein